MFQDDVASEINISVCKPFQEFASLRCRTEIIHEDPSPEPSSPKASAGPAENAPFPSFTSLRNHRFVAYKIKKKISRKKGGILWTLD